MSKFPCSFESVEEHYIFPCMFCSVCQFQVNVLKRVLEEVEKVVNEFKGTLYKSMEDPQIDLANVRLLILHCNVIFCTGNYKINKDVRRCLS